MMSKSLTFAQISDTHLFANINDKHCQANVYQNLCLVLRDINRRSQVDGIIFTGDLTQDHSAESYRNFVNAFDAEKIAVPVYYLAGNHDEHNLLEHYLGKAPFQQSKLIESAHWQIFLLNSKSATPAGLVEQQQLSWLAQNINPEKSQLVMMHHHPIDVGYFIDRHGLTDKAEFWHEIKQHASIKAICCGHVHQNLSLSKNVDGRKIKLYTCPATSIQFDPSSETVLSNGQPAGYRLLTLTATGDVITNAIFI
jgi:Icc protein